MLKVDLNPKVCLLPLVLGFRMKYIFHLSLVIKLATLATYLNKMAWKDQEGTDNQHFLRTKIPQVSPLCDTNNLEKRLWGKLMTTRVWSYLPLFLVGHVDNNLVAYITAQPNQTNKADILVRKLCVLNNKLNRHREAAKKRSGQAIKRRTFFWGFPYTD